MPRKHRNIANRVQLVVDEVLHLLGQASVSRADVVRSRTLQLTKLEERILMSASPMAIIAEVASVGLDASPFAIAVDAVNDHSVTPDAVDIANPAQNIAVSDQTSVAKDGVSQDAAGVRGIELIVIDSRVQDADTLLESLLNTDRDVRLLRLDASTDGLSQITDKLEQLGNVSAVHLLTHGSDGQILLGSTVLNARTLAQHIPEFLAWQHNLTANADLLIYGCDVAATPEGRDFVASLANLTAADVAASTDATGSRSFSGDWELEYQLGVIETEVFVSSAISGNWNDLLGVITVSTTNDVLDGDTSSVAALLASKGTDGFISLREAIIATNNTVGADTIFLTAGTFTFSIGGQGENAAFTGDLDITDSLTITGAGSGLSTINAGSLDRVFELRGANTVTIEDVTIRGGVMAASNLGGGLLVESGASLNLTRVVVTANSANQGGGVYNQGTLTALDTLFTANTADNDGGGFYNDGGTVLLHRVTVSGNTASRSGGGIYNNNNNNLSLINVTLSQNTATQDGGGLYTHRDVTVSNSTIAFNNAASGDGIFQQSGTSTVFFRNSVLYNPSGVNANRAMISLGNNIDSDGTVGLAGPADQSGINPQLDATLQNNGGFVTTHRLLSGSAAIDTGSTVSSPAVDARNTARDSAPDIGAYEVQGLLAARAEALVNTATTNTQSTSAESRGSTHAVAAARDGSHVVVWSSLNQDGGGWGVYGQRFDAAGNKVGVEFRINQTTTNDQKYATVAMNGRGDFVVSWTSVSQDGSGNGVYARRYNAAGTALGGEFRVNATTTGDQDSPVVAMAADGRFLIVWEGQGGGDADGIFGRWYTTNGVPATSEIRINTTTTGVQGDPSVAMAPDGKAVVVWSDSSGVWAQRFDSGGAVAGGEIHVETSSSAGAADVEMAADGSFVVTYRQTLLDLGVYFRRYDATGAPLGSFAQIANSTIANDQTNPSIAMDDTGNFLIVWEGNGTGDTDGVFGRQYAASGTALNSFEFRINGTTTGVQSMASAALLTGGNFVVAWSGAAAADSSGVYTRQFANTPPTITPIANQTISENSATSALSFTIGDAETSASALVVSASSSNSALVSPGGLVLAGSGASRTLTVTPNANQSGTATITVTVNDSFTTTSTTFLLTVTLVNDAPVITSNGGGVNATISVAENTTAVTTVTATDADLPVQTLTYSISGGADAARFAINSTTGALSFLTAPNYEAPTDAGANNVYDVTVRISDGTLTDTQNIAVTVTAVNEAPVITSNGGGANASISVAENTTTVTTVTSTDPDLPAQTRTYSISGGADASKFAINSTTGVLTFVAAPNFESAADVSANNVYDVIVRASDGTLTDTQSIAVTVTAVNDNTPVITSNGGGASASISVAENTTAVTTVVATDADLPAQTLTYSISGGADASRFAINSTTGVLTFVSARDFESPADSGSNNVYDVIVRVSDGTLTDTQNIAVTVTPVNDNTPVITSNGGGASAAISVAENTTAVTTVVATDADLPAQTLTYSISGGADAARFAINSTTGVLTFVSARNFESPEDIDANNIYDVIVQASDGTLTDTQAIAVTITAVNDNTPVITSNGGGANASISVIENTQTVTTVTATDADLPGQTLTYSINGGADASKFTINSSTGVLSFATAPDFEAPTDAGGNNIYDITVQVSDGSLSDTQAISVAVTNSTTGDVLIATQDTYIKSSSSTLNYGQSTSLVLDRTGGGIGNSRILLLFDLSDVPVNATITSATLVMQATQNGGALNINVYQMTQAWQEGTANGVVGTANWTQRQAGVNWTTAGGDYAGTAVATLNTGAIGQHSWNLTSLVSDWKALNKANYGVMIGSPDTGTTTVTYNSSEGTIVPQLLVSFDVSNAPPIITSNGGGVSGTVNVAENATSVTTVVATDANLPGQTLTYSISGGVDAARFAINSSTGLLSFASAPNYESPADVGANNTYDVIVQVSDGITTDSQSLAVTVTAVNDNTPTITSNGSGATAAISVAENATAVTTVTSTDADLPVQTLTYTISGGVDASKFSINSSTGVLNFVTAPDFDAPADSGLNNVYDVIVQVSDSTLTDTQNIAVTVTPVNDNTPVITSNGGGASAPISVAENTTAITTVAATDADLPAQTLAYSISGGADAAKFSINSSTGVLSFVAAPDFEVPTDVGSNNVYDVTVQVSDGMLTDTQALSVAVTNTNDAAPVVTAGQTFTVSELATNGTSPGTVTATDADGTTTFSGWTITAGNSAGVFGISASTGQLTVVDRTNLNFDITPSYVLSVTVSDGINTSAVQTITINVTESSNTAPVANDDSYTVLEGGALNQTVVNGWFNSNWQYRRQLVFNNSASSTNLINNTVLVKLHASAPDAIQIDYSATQNSGQDLRFVDPDGTVLAYQIEQWDESGYSYVWVKVPQIDSGSTTDSISMYYGNPAVTAGQNAAAVWTSNLVAVFHMNANAIDSTTYANDGTTTSVVSATGQIARSGAFDGLNSSINAGSASSVDNIFAGGGAISAWINPVSWGEGGYGRIADKGTSTTGALGWGFQVAGTTALDGYLIFESDFTSTVGRWRTAAGTVAQNSWQNVAVVYDNSLASNVPKLYVNGVQLSLTVMSASAGNARSDAAQDLYIGNRSGATDRTFSGRIDEVRFSSTALTADQVKADYKTAQGTFISSGSVETGPGGLLDNDFDNEENVLIVSLVSGPAHAASFTLNADGSFSYVHDGSETTTDSFIYRVTDGTLTDTATVTLTVTPVNDSIPVVTASQSFDVSEAATNGTAVGMVTASDDDAGTAFTNWTITGGNTGGVFAIDSNTGAISVANNSSLDYETLAAYSLTVTVSDSLNTSAARAVTINVTPVNDNTPVITSNGGGAAASINVSENSTAVTTLTATDADLPVPTLTYSISGGTDAAKFAINSTTGVLTFVTAPDYENPTDSGTNNVYNVTVQVSDGTLTMTQAIEVTVLPINDNTPVITSNGGGATASVSVAENATAVTTVTATDADLPAQTLTYSITGGADAARFSINSSTGALTFVTAPNFEVPTDVGADNVYNVNVQVSDGTFTDTQEIGVDVTDINEAPTANAGGPYAISEGDALTVVAGLSLDPEGLPLTYAWDIDGDGLFNDATGSTTTLTWSQLNSLASPIIDNGTRALAVRVTDAGGISTVATTGLTITNTAPTVNVTGNATTSSGMPYVVTFSKADPGADTITMYRVNWGDGTTEDISGTAASATHTYLVQGGTRSITATATDEDGTFPMNGGPLVVTVLNSPPSAPTLSDSVVPGLKNGASVGTLSFTDPDSGDSHTWTVSDNRFRVDGSTLRLKPGQQLDPLTEPTVTLTVTVTDASGAAASTSFTLHVNNAPLSANDAYAVDGTRQLSVSSPSVGVLANDSDADGDTFSANLVSGPTHAATFGLNPDGTFWYRATTGYSGGDTFTYRATDSVNSGELTTVTLTVSQPASLSYTSIVSAVPEQPILTAPLKVGTLTIIDDGIGTNTLTLTGTDAALFELDGSRNLFLKAGVTIDYAVQTRFDVTAVVNDAAIAGTPDFSLPVVVNVLNINDAPVASLLPDVTLLEDAPPGTIGTAAVFFDRDGDALTHSLQVVSATPGLIKTISINSTTGVISYSLNANAFGMAVLQVTGTDPSNATASQQFQLNVQSVNDAPVVQNYSGSTLIGQALSIGASGVLTTASDADFDALSVTLVSGTANGTIVLQANGSFVYTPREGFYGVDTFRFVASDGVLTSHIATASIHVIPIFGGPTGGSTSGGSSSSGTQTSSSSSAGRGSTASGSTSGGTGNNGSGNSGTAHAANGSSNSTTGAVDPLIAGLLNPGLSGSTNTNGVNNDDDIVGILPTAEATAAKRIVVVTGIGESATADRSDSHDFTRRMGGAFAAQDFDVMFSPTGTSESFVRLNAEREVLYRELADRVDGQSDSVNEQLAQTTRLKGRVVGSVGVVTTGFSVGYLFWAVRLGTLASGLLAQVPAWSMLDPLLVIDGDQKDEDKESLENIMDRQKAKMEKAQANSVRDENT